MKQPLLGITATLLVMVVALGLISLFTPATFTGWVSYCLICFIPTEVVMGVIWGMSQPAFATKQKQPLRGILHILFNAVIAVVVGPIIWMVAGAGVNPPAPMLAMYSVCAVAVTFWLTIMWGGWPFTSISKNPLVGGLTVLIAAYAITLGLFKIFFNYEFMQGAPVYVASLDPHGMFNGWSAMVFFVTFLVGLFAALGGIGTGAFRDSSLVVRTWGSTPYFDENCSSCPHVMHERTFRWGAQGFERVDDRVQTTPYTVFTELIIALVNGDNETALRRLADPSLVAFARRLDWHDPARGRWRAEPEIGRAHV